MMHIKGKTEHKGRMMAKKERLENKIIRLCDLTPEEKKEYRRLERKMLRQEKRAKELTAISR